MGHSRWFRAGRAVKRLWSFLRRPIGPNTGLRTSILVYCQSLGWWSMVAIAHVGIDVLWILDARTEAMTVPMWLWAILAIGTILIASFIPFHRLRLQQKSGRPVLAARIAKGNPPRLLVRNVGSGTAYGCSARVTSLEYFQVGKWSGSLFAPVVPFRLRWHDASETAPFESTIPNDHVERVIELAYPAGRGDLISFNSDVSWNFSGWLRAKVVISSENQVSCTAAVTFGLRLNEQAEHKELHFVEAFRLPDDEQDVNEMARQWDLENRAQSINRTSLSTKVTPNGERRYLVRVAHRLLTTNPEEYEGGENEWESRCTSILSFFADAYEQSPLGPRVEVLMSQAFVDIHKARQAGVNGIQARAEALRRFLDEVTKL